MYDKYGIYQKICSLYSKSKQIQVNNTIGSEMIYFFHMGGEHDDWYLS